MSDEAANLRRSLDDEAIMRALRYAPEGMTSPEVFTRARLHNVDAVDNALDRLVRAGQAFRRVDTRSTRRVYVHGMWRDRYRAEQVHEDRPARVSSRADAAEQVAIGVAAYLDDPTPPRWDFIRDAVDQWKAMT